MAHEWLKWLTDRVRKKWLINGSNGSWKPFINPTSEWDIWDLALGRTRKSQRGHKGAKGAITHELSRHRNWTQTGQLFPKWKQFSHEMAVAKAHGEFDKFRVKQDQAYLSDFDQAFARYLKGRPE